jgi:hypothetical protein
MDEIRYTLISDGPSDRALIPILNWVLREKGDMSRIQAESAYLGRFPKPPKGLRERILCAIDLFPCDLLFVHMEQGTIFPHAPRPAWQGPEVSHDPSVLR